MDITKLLDEIRILAQNGLTYAGNEHDERRYARMLELTAQCYEDMLDLPADEIRRRFVAEIGHVTPKLGAEGAIFDPSNRILLMRRADDGTWCLPCGWVEPSESPRAAAIREVKEETGLDVRPTALVDVFTRPAGNADGVHALVSVVYVCESEGGELTCSAEGTELRYWDIDLVPVWHMNHEQLARAALAAHADAGRYA